MSGAHPSPVLTELAGTMPLYKAPIEAALAGPEADADLVFGLSDGGDLISLERFRSDHGPHDQRYSVTRYAGYPRYPQHANRYVSLSWWVDGEGATTPLNMSMASQHPKAGRVFPEGEDELASKMLAPIVHGTITWFSPSTHRVDGGGSEARVVPRSNVSRLAWHVGNAVVRAVKETGHRHRVGRAQAAVARSIGRELARR